MPAPQLRQPNSLRQPRTARYSPQHKSRVQALTLPSTGCSRGLLQHVQQLLALQVHSGGGSLACGCLHGGSLACGCLHGGHVVELGHEVVHLAQRALQPGGCSEAGVAGGAEL